MSTKENKHTFFYSEQVLDITDARFESGMPQYLIPDASRHIVIGTTTLPVQESIEVKRQEWQTILKEGKTPVMIFNVKSFDDPVQAPIAAWVPLEQENETLEPTQVKVWVYLMVKGHGWEATPSQESEA